MFVFEPQNSVNAHHLEPLQLIVNSAIPLLVCVALLGSIILLLNVVTDPFGRGRGAERVTSDDSERIDELEKENMKLREMKQPISISFTAEDFQQAQKNMERLVTREFAPLTPYPVEETKEV